MVFQKLTKLCLLIYEVVSVYRDALGSIRLTGKSDSIMHRPLTARRVRVRTQSSLLLKLNSLKAVKRVRLHTCTEKCCTDLTGDNEIQLFTANKTDFKES